NHLSSDENINFAASEASEHALEIAHVPHSVTIHTADAHIWKQLLEIGLQSLGPFADIVNVFTVALGTSYRRPPRETAVVAHQLIDRSMIGERHAAGTALKCKPTMAAQKKCRVATPVQQDHRLLTARQPCGNGVKQRARENHLFTRRRIFFAHVDDLD